MNIKIRFNKNKIKQTKETKLTDNSYTVIFVYESFRFTVLLSALHIQSTQQDNNSIGFSKSFIGYPTYPNFYYRIENINKHLIIIIIKIIIIRETHLHGSCQTTIQK